MIGNAVVTLLEHPDQLVRLRAQPELMPTAIDEVLRFSSPIQFDPRIAAKDMELHGVKVRENEPILVFGQTALFFYLAHFGLLAALRAFIEPADLGLAYLIAAGLLVVLYPVCLAYRVLKRRHPRSLLRFV